LTHGELLAEVASTLAPCTDDVFQTDGLARELLTHGPTEKTLLVIDTDFGHISRVIADEDVLADVGSQRGVDIAQGLESEPLLLHTAGLRDRQS
jgi:hypothetical protein